MPLPDSLFVLKADAEGVGSRCKGRTAILSREKHHMQVKIMVGTRGVIGIRRENKSMWERRCPLVPEDVKVLIDSGIRVLVQPSTLRCYSDQAYLQVGAEVTEDLSRANVVLGIKEVGMEFLQAGQTYVMFTHVAKAQPYNMPLLDKLLELGTRVIDYEYNQDPNPPKNRLIAFGRFAGMAASSTISVVWVYTSLSAIQFSLPVRGQFLHVP